MRLEVRRKKDLSFIICLVTPWVHPVLLVSCHYCVNVLPWLPGASARRPGALRCCVARLLLPATASGHLHPAPRLVVGLARPAALPWGRRAPCSFGACSLLPLQVLLLLTRTFSVSLLCHQGKLFHSWGLSVQAFPSRGRLPRASSASCVNH